MATKVVISPEHEETVSIQILSDVHLDLGNNFSYQHFIDAVENAESDELADAMLDSVLSYDAEFLIVANGNYGTVQLNSCTSDLHDHIKHWRG